MDKKTKTSLRKLIYIPVDDAKFIRKAFGGISQVMVHYAATRHAERGDSDLARRIRKLAAERGCVEVYDKIPVCECWHDADDRMTQDFGKGIVLVAQKQEGTVEIFDDNKLLDRWTNVSIDQLEMIQKRAAGYASKKLMW